MGLRNSFAHIFTDTQKLLSAIDANVETMPELSTAKVDLEKVFGEVRDLVVRRDTLAADKQVLSKQLKEAVHRNQEKSRELRSFLVFKLGMRNEKLVEFKVPPKRLGRTRRSSPTEPLPSAPPGSGLSATG